VCDISLIYLDSTIWASYILGDRHKDKAEFLFKKIFQDNNKILISTLNLLEVIEIIRRRVIESMPFAGVTPEVQQSIKDCVKEKTEFFMQKVIELVRQDKLYLSNPTKSIDDCLTLTLKLLTDNFGTVDTTSHCFICNKKTPERYRYVGVGHYDIQHIIYAKECCADEFITFDKGFLQLKNFDSSELKITIQ